MKSNVRRHVLVQCALEQALSSLWIFFDQQLTAGVELVCIYNDVSCGFKVLRKTCVNALLML